MVRSTVLSPVFCLPARQPVFQVDILPPGQFQQQIAVDRCTYTAGTGLAELFSLSGGI